MKTKNTKIKYYFCEDNELDSLAEYLEEQALLGWELTNKMSGFLGFRRCEPRHVKISVELVNSMMDDMENERFISYCTATGWKHIFNDRKIQIFENDDFNAEPINTDPETKLASIHKRCLKSRIMLYLVCLGIIGFIQFDLIDYKNYQFYLSTPLLLIAIIIPIFCALFIGIIIDYFVWYHKAREITKAGLEPEYKERFLSKVSKVIFWLIYGVVVVGAFLDLMFSNEKSSLVYVIIVFACIVLFEFGVQIYYAKNNKTRKGTAFKVNCWRIVFIFFIFIVGINIISLIDADNTGEPLISLKSLGVATSEESAEKQDNSYNGTFILKEYYGEDYSPNSKKYKLSYIAYSTSNHRVYNMVLNQAFLNSEFYKFKVVKAKQFGANKVYYDSEGGNYLLLYDKYIVEIDTNVPLNSERTKVIEKTFS